MSYTKNNSEKVSTDNFELSDGYKAMMDFMIERHKNEEVNYTSWEKVKSNLKKKL